MREVIVSEHLWGKIKEVNDYLINELHLSEEATEKRIRRMEQFVMDLRNGSIIPCAVSKSGGHWVTTAPYSKRLGIRLRGVRRRRDRARYGQYRTLGGITRYIHQRKSSEAGYSDGLRSPYPIAGTIYGPTKATEPQTAEKTGKIRTAIRHFTHSANCSSSFRPFFHHTTGLHNPAHLQCSIRGRVSSHTSAVIVTHTGQILYAVADRCSAS